MSFIFVSMRALSYSPTNMLTLLLSGCAESTVETGNRAVDAGFGISKFRRLSLSINTIRHTYVESSCDYEDNMPLFIHDYITPRLQLSL